LGADTGAGAGPGEDNSPGVAKDGPPAGATVAPFNIPSMKDKFSLGLRIGALKEKYGGKLRYIFYKELHRSWQPTAVAQDVPMEDRGRQVELLQAGWIGTRQQSRHG
jgi:hypothetical protein